MARLKKKIRCGTSLKEKATVKIVQVEVMAQVKDPRLSAQLDDIFESATDPQTRCWELGPDGRWTASPQEGQTVRDHQVSMMERHRYS